MGFVERSGTGRTRTFRLDAAFNDMLEAEAEQQGLSVNNLTERIIERYINHTRWIDQIESLTIHPLTIQKIFDELSEEQIMRLGSKLGARVPSESFMMSGMPLDGVTARYFLERILGEYDHWFSVSYHHSKPYFFLQTSLGDKWLLFVEAYLKAFYIENLSQEVECIRIENSLQILL